jgi:hypothetical protein
MSFLVLHVRPYDFDSDDGRRISGASVTYLELTNGPVPTQGPGELGVAPLTITTTVDAAQGIVQAPGIYDLRFTQRRGKAGRPVLVLADAQLVRQVQLSEL